MLTLESRIAERVTRADYDQWRAAVHAVNGCAKPIRLAGASQIRDSLTGKVLHHHGGDIFVPCGNRRATVCQNCSDRYAADAFHLIRAGMSGGSKNIPESVADKMRAFVTLTAPSFGPVHGRRTTASGKRIPCGCGEHHHEADTRLGSPLDPESYDYTGAVLWQANTGALWQRFTTRLRRTLARMVGLTVREFRFRARLSYAKVAEYQRRGLVHYHAVFRLDGPDGPADPAPAWATPDLLRDAVHVAAGTVEYTIARPDGTPLRLVWGEQVDVRDIRPASAAEFEEDGEISEQALAGYIAKYATKGTGKSEAADRPIRSDRDIALLKVSAHHRRMIETCWDLGELDQYGKLNLHRWAHMLGFRGHFLTKSLLYSATFRVIRGDRRDYRRAETLDRLGLDSAGVTVVNNWWFEGSGYLTDAETELAAGIAERIRADRKARYSKENRS
ncbi:replication initiator [Amycolatopsis lurida]